MKDTQMDEKHVKKCRTPVVLRQMKIKTTLRFPLPPIRMVMKQVTAHSESLPQKQRKTSKTKVRQMEIYQRYRAEVKEFHWHSGKHTDTESNYHVIAYNFLHRRSAS